MPERDEGSAYEEVEKGTIISISISVNVYRFISGPVYKSGMLCSWNWRFVFAWMPYLFYYKSDMGACGSAFRHTCTWCNLCINDYRD